MYGISELVYWQTAGMCKYMNPGAFSYVTDSQIGPTLATNLNKKLFLCLLYFGKALVVLLEFEFCVSGL